MTAVTWRALNLVAALAAIGCTDPDGTAPTTTADATAASCPDPARREDGGCCPDGSFYDFQAAACAPVGPAGCELVALGDVSLCAPRWCAGPADAGICSPAQVAAGEGCPAGSARADVGGPCILAGRFAGSGVSGPLDPLTMELGAPDNTGAWPQLVPLPALTDTFFCRAGPTAAVRFCRDGERALCRRGANGALPDPDRCVLAGVTWPGVCPPGFILDVSVAPGLGQLPACKPDPAMCGDTEYGPNAPKDGPKALFVHASKGGDTATGTRQSPLRTISKALAIAQPGSTIAVAAGTYTGPHYVDRSMTLIGRCAALVKLTAPQQQAALAVAGKEPGAVYIQGLHVAGPTLGVGVQGPVTAELVDIWLTDVEPVGLAVRGADATLWVRSLVVRGVTGDANGLGGAGLSVQDGAHLVARDVRITAARTVGLEVHLAHADVQQLLVDGTQVDQANGQFGYGAVLSAGGSLIVRSARMSGNRGSGLRINADDGESVAVGVLVDGTLSAELDVDAPGGIVVQGQGKLLLSAARVSGSFADGLLATGWKADLDATAVLVDGTVQTAEGTHGKGMSGHHGARIRGRDLRVSGCVTVGLAARHANTDVEVSRVLVDDIRPRDSDGAFGWGVNAEQGARLSATDMRVTDAHHFGIFARNVHTSLTLRRAVVDTVHTRKITTSIDAGIAVFDTADVTIDRARVTAVRANGVTVSDPGTRLRATGLLVDGTLTEAGSGYYGRGVGAQTGATTTLVGGVMRNNADGGVIGVKSGALTAIGLVIADTAADSDGRYGTGFGCDVATGPCTLIASRVLTSHTAAVDTRGGSMTIVDSVLAGTRSAQYPRGARGPASAEFVTVADGLIALIATLHVQRTLIGGNARAGIHVIGGIDTSITDTTTSGGAYGLVWSGAAPTLTGSLLRGDPVSVTGDTKLFTPPPPQAAPLD